LVYLEDQYLWSRKVAEVFARALRRSPKLRLIIVIPLYPDQAGRVTTPANLVGREIAMQALQAAGGDRIAIYGIENQHGTPVYVHAKVCVVDDCWINIGSDNLNRRSWTHDSELSCAVLSPETNPTFAQTARLAIAREHLGRDDGDDADLRDPVRAFHAFAEAAGALDAWHGNGESGPRPPGRLRAYSHPPLSRTERLWSLPIYRWIYDPDGRSPLMRIRNQI
jgi:phosphatidylserine/phosphatidylglycerophosphate/cardiolipin synthase-like enzyme